MAIRQASIPFSGKSFSLDMKARVRILFPLLSCLLSTLLGTIARAQLTGILPQVVVTGSAGSLTSPDLNSVAERFHNIPVPLASTLRSITNLGAGLIWKTFSPTHPVC